MIKILRVPSATSASDALIANHTRLDGFESIMFTRGIHRAEDASMTIYDMYKAFLISIPGTDILSEKMFSRM